MVLLAFWFRELSVSFLWFRELCWLSYLSVGSVGFLLALLASVGSVGFLLVLWSFCWFSLFFNANHKNPNFGNGAFRWFCKLLVGSVSFFKVLLVL